MDGTIITKKGINLLSKLAATKGTLNFVRAAVGTGKILSGGDPDDMEDLAAYKMDGKIAVCEGEGDTAKVTIQICTDNLESDFIISEAGIFAEGEDGEEILYAYIDLSDDPQYMYAKGSQTIKFVEIVLEVLIDTDMKVNAYISPDSMITHEELEKRLGEQIGVEEERATQKEAELKTAIQENQKELTEHIKDTNNPHKITADQMGLGAVDNTADTDKPVSTAQQAAIDTSYQQATGYADKKVADLTPAGIGAFPGVVSVKEAGTDLNDYTEEGIFYFDVDHKPQNIPAGSNGTLVVVTAFPNYAKQLWFRHGSAGNNTETYVRTLLGTNWYPWTRYAVDADLGNYLPKSGGSMAGALGMNALRLLATGSSAYWDIMKAWDDGDGANYGVELVLGGGGNTFIGGGECAAGFTNGMREALQDEKKRLEGEAYYQTGEGLYLAADEDILFYSNCQDLQKRLGITYDKNGNLRPLVDGTRSLGTAACKWGDLRAAKAMLYGALHIEGNVPNYEDNCIIGLHNSAYPNSGLSLWLDKEGANLRFTSVNGKHYEFDTLDDLLRIYTQGGVVSGHLDQDLNLRLPGCVEATEFRGHSLGNEANYYDKSYIKKIYGTEAIFGKNGKVQIWEDKEGGNIRIISPGGQMWEIDANDDTGIRFFTYGSETNGNAVCGCSCDEHGTFTSWQLRTEPIPDPDDPDYMRSVYMEGDSITFLYDAGYDNATTRMTGDGIEYWSEFTLKDYGSSTEGFRFLYHEFLPLVTGKNNIGSSSMKFNNIYAVNGVIQTSDRTEKKEIENLDAEKTKAFIMGLNPVSYQMKEGTSGRTHYGLIAQDIEELMSQLHIDSKDFAGFIKSPKVIRQYEDENGKPLKRPVEKIVEGEYDYSLRYEEFIAPLIKLVQTQQTEIKALKELVQIQQNEIDMMKEQYQMQQKEIESMKAQLAQVQAWLGGQNLS